MNTDMLSEQAGKRLFSRHLSETFYYSTSFTGNASSSTATTHCCMRL